MESAPRPTGHLSLASPPTVTSGKRRKASYNERPRRANRSGADCRAVPTSGAAPHPDPAHARILTTGNESHSGLPSLVARFFVSRPQAIHPSNPEKNRTPHARHYLDAACNYLDRPQNLPAAVYASARGVGSTDAFDAPRNDQAQSRAKRQQGGGGQPPRATVTTTHKLPLENLLTSWPQFDTLPSWRTIKQP